MAGDWIKMRADLQTHPKVVRISSAMCTDKLRVIGGLHAVWSLFDAHSLDGSLDGYTVDALDSLIGWPGFSQAMVAVGWLQVSGHSLNLPRFDSHNGKGAKRRATETERKRASRVSAGDPQDDRNVSASFADKKRTREEKRREDIEPPTPRRGVSEFPPGFDRFWSAYPRKVAKGQAAKAFARLRADEALIGRMLAAVRQQSASEAWRKDGGQFIPHPATWLNGRRWEDEAPAVGVGGAPDIFAGAL